MFFIAFQAILATQDSKAKNIDNFLHLNFFFQLKDCRVGPDATIETCGYEEK